MSPALLTKYLDAAKEIAEPRGAVAGRVSRSRPSTTQRDWTEEMLAEIRDFYGAFTDNGGGTAVNLQGIVFDTKDGGVCRWRNIWPPRSSERDALTIRRRKTHRSASRREHGLNAKYLGTLWDALNDTKPSLAARPDSRALARGQARRCRRARCEASRMAAGAVEVHAASATSASATARRRGWSRSLRSPPRRKCGSRFPRRPTART